jgi:hypothetical protein
MAKLKLTDAELRLLYGTHIVISRLVTPAGEFTLIHLDRPTPDIVRLRMKSFDPDEFFDCDCGICQLTREGAVVVFDETVFDDEEVPE